MTDNPVRAMLEYFRDGERWWNPKQNNNGACLITCPECTVGSLELVREVILEQFPGRMIANTIPSFNDHRDTTWPDVRLVLEKAAVKWDERHS